MSRFLNNERLSLEELTGAICHSWYREDLEYTDLYLIQDSSDFNANRHKGRISPGDTDLGPLWGKNSAGEYGFFMHPCYVIEGQSGFPLGYADIHLWNRIAGEPDRHERNYKRQPIEEKISYRWIRAIEQSRQVLSEHKGQRYHIMDREADIYELFARPKLANEHLVIRANRDRSIKNQQGDKSLLWAYLEGQSPKSIIELEVPRQGNRSGRKAKMKLYYERLSIPRPKDRTKAQGPDFLDLTVIQIKELEETVPQGESPVHWCLWTDIEVNSTTEALRIVDIYKKRWAVEELFSIVKSKGLDTESTQVESGIALKRLVLLALQASLSILQLIKDRDNDFEQPMESILGSPEIEFVAMLSKSLEGKTEKLKNPHPQKSLAYLAWVVARLGGYKGYKSQSPPGPKTMSWGWKRFTEQLNAWNLIRNLEFR